MLLLAGLKKLYYVVFTVIVISFIWQVALGLCPVP